MVQEKKGSGRERIVELDRHGRGGGEEEEEGDVSLGRLLGAGRGAPIIVAGDRSETSPGNPAALPVNHVTRAPLRRQEPLIQSVSIPTGGLRPGVHPGLGALLKIDFTCLRKISHS